MKPHISIITLGVKDLKKSTDFYEKIGFPVERSKDITFIKTLENMNMALYGLDDMVKESGVSKNTGDFSGITLAHNVISEEQVDGVIEEVRLKGAKVIDEPQKRHWGGYSGYFQDIDGYLWEVAHNPFSPEIAVDEDEN